MDRMLTLSSGVSISILGGPSAARRRARGQAAQGKRCANQMIRVHRCSSAANIDVPLRPILLILLLISRRLRRINADVFSTNPRLPGTWRGYDTCLPRVQDPKTGNRD